MSAMPPPHIGRVALVVADLDRSVRFYEQVIGLRQIDRRENVARLGAGERALLELHSQPGARPTQRAAGLYHFALLLPSRHDLARTLYHLLTVNGPISGYADHAVSEAIYLTDPDGHGIEIYRDRPRSEWMYPNGALRITTEPLDINGVLGDLAEQPRAPVVMPAGTMVGHIHLQVSNIPATHDFYTGIIGFDLIARYGPGAAFFAANGYHHHLGTNTWAGVGLPPAPPDSARLLWYEICQPDAAAVEAIRSRLAPDAIPTTLTDGDLVVTDPSGISIRLTS
jgi:catechol 2,3-dioxygenase